MTEQAAIEREVLRAPGPNFDPMLAGPEGPPGRPEAWRCRKCGASVSNKLATCPKCGAGR